MINGGRTIVKTLRMCIAFVLNKSKIIRFDKQVFIPIEMYLGIIFFFYEYCLHN